MDNLTVKFWHLEKIPHDWEIVSFYESCLSWNIFNGSIVMVCNRAFLLAVIEPLEIESLFVDIIVAEEYKHGRAPLYIEFPLGTIFTSNTHSQYEDLNKYNFDATKTLLHTGEKGGEISREIIVWNTDKKLDDYVALCTDYVAQGEDIDIVEGKLLYEMYNYDSAMIYHDAGVNRHALNNNPKIAENFVNLRMKTMQQHMGDKATQNLKSKLCQLQTFRA
jgi:hypothetical protein